MRREQSTSSPTGAFSFARLILIVRCLVQRVQRPDMDRGVIQLASLPLPVIRPTPPLHSSRSRGQTACGLMAIGWSGGQRAWGHGHGTPVSEERKRSRQKRCACRR